MDIIVVLIAMFLLLLLQGFLKVGIALAYADNLKLHHRANQGHK